MGLSTINGDLQVLGNFSAQTMSAAASSVTDASVASNAAIQVTKTQHLIIAGSDFGVAAGTAPGADVVKVIFVASGTATIRIVKAVLRDTGTSTDVKFDLLKCAAGSSTSSSILNAVIAFTNADTDNTPKAGSLSSATLAAGDMLIASMDWTSATGATGPWMWVEVDEAAN